MDTTASMNGREIAAPQIIAVAREVAALPDIAAWWDDSAEELARATVELEWWDMMGKVERWAGEAAAGHLSDRDAQLVAEIVAMLQRYHNIAATLNLPIPAVLAPSATEHRHAAAD